jgi:hypothetical protein
VLEVPGGLNSTPQLYLLEPMLFGRPLSKSRTGPPPRKHKIIQPSHAISLFPRVLRAPAFAPAPRPFSLPLRSAKPPHSGRSRFELVPQPENPSVPLTRPFAPATMVGLAPLALRVWAYANGRPLHSGPFRPREQGPPLRVCWQTKRHEQADSENKISR